MKLKLLLVTTCLIIFHTLAAFDLPVFYRTPYFQDIFGKKEAQYSTQFSVRYMHGDTHKAMDDSDTKKSLFSSYGYTNIATMGYNIDNPNALVQKYWTGDNAPFNPDNYTPSDNDGNIDFMGKFELNEVDFTIQQDIFWGFFAQVYVPLRDIKLKNITYENLGSKNIGGNSEKSIDPVNVEDFMKNQLDPILNSMGLQNYEKSFSKSNVSEILGSIGWHKYSRVKSPIVKSLSATVLAGVLFPITGKMPENTSFAIPLGYGQYWAGVLKAKGFVGVFDWLGVGGHVGTSIFFSERRERRMKTSPSQAGWILLEKGFCTYDPGQQWDAGAYLQLGPIFGLSLNVGYSYTKQEQSELNLRDSDFLKSYVESQLDQNAWAQSNNQFPMVVSPDKIINTDKRLRPWSTHTLHLVAKYEFESAKFCSSIQFEYDYPFYGDLSWPTDVYGGTANLMFKFKF